ncbi:MAG: hypothetical protein GY719_22775 [bacterium]|nr:hypothetical protein [bacterium]
MRDDFNVTSFSNNDGPNDWDGDWIENDPVSGGGGPSSGNVRVRYGYLKLDDYPDTGGEPSAARQVDLTDAEVATLTFDFRTTSGVDPSDAVAVEVSSDGGANWAILETIDGITGSTFGSRSYDISAHISSETQIRFRVSNKYGGRSEYFKVDWVQIDSECDGPDPEELTLDVTKSGTGTGTVTSAPAGITCGGDCSEAYVSGTGVVLTPTPDAGSMFVGWSGSDADCNDGSVTMTMNLTCDAQFDVETFTLNVTKSGSGTGTVGSAPAGISCGGDCSEVYASGTGVVLTPTPDVGSVFVGWSGSDADCNDGSVTMTMNLTCDAQFDEEPPGAECPCLLTGDWFDAGGGGPFINITWAAFEDGSIPATSCFDLGPSNVFLGGAGGTFAAATPDLSMPPPLAGSGPGCAVLGPGDAMVFYKAVTDPAELMACADLLRTAGCP